MVHRPDLDTHSPGGCFAIGRATGSRIPLLAALLVSLLGVAVIPAVAGAARVYTRVDEQRSTVYEAAPGETNRLVVQDVDGDPTRFRLVDAAAPLTVLPDCLAFLGGPVALCPKDPTEIHLGDRADLAVIATLFAVPQEGSVLLVVAAGEGDDEVFADFLWGVVDGGDGDDRIRFGARGSAWGDGGPGRDVIQGNRNSFRLTGGPDDDLIATERRSGGVDVEGDEGNDVLLLRDAPHGDVEIDTGANGGPGDDVLFVRPDGAAAPEPGSALWSLRLVGAEGADVLIGGPSRDTFEGWTGDDVLITRDGQAEFVNCGEGFDIAYADPEDNLVDCETALRPPLARVADLRAALARTFRARIVGLGVSPPRAQRTLRGVIRAAL